MLFFTFLLAISPLFARSGGAAAAPGDILRCSTKADWGQSNLPSHSQAISADGRYVAFTSCADNLVPGDYNGRWDIFRKDLQTGAILRCSTNASWNEANGDSFAPSISADGRYVAFNSSATNLVSNDTNGQWDVFRKDLQTGDVVRCSTDKDWFEATGGGSYDPSVSADGRYVAFSSDATNLVPNDTNGIRDVFCKSLSTGHIVRCSTDSSWGQSSGGYSNNPSISAGGSYVAFSSTANNLVPGDTNGLGDIFRKDLSTGAIARCSTDKDGNQVSDGDSYRPSISADGLYVAFYSFSASLVPGDTNSLWDVFRKDVQTGAIVRCSTRSDGGQSSGEEGSFNPSISSDGRYVAFHSSATNLVSGDTNGQQDVFRKDLKTGAVVRCSTRADGGQASDGWSSSPAINADGRFVAFDSNATNLVPGDTNSAGDVFRKELAPPRPAIASIDPSSGPAGTEVTLEGVDFGDTRGSSYVSFDGTQASEYGSWSDTEIVCVVPAGLAGELAVTVTTLNGISNRVIFSVEGPPPPPPPPPPPATTFYFAEGYTGEGFEEWLCLGQPVDAPLQVRVTYLFADGSPSIEQTYDVPGLSRFTMDVNSVVGPGREVSMVCEADAPFIAERPMYFDYKGAWTGGHDAVGADSPSPTWYFAEGYTGEGFEEWICVLNPGDTDASLTFRFQTQEEGEKVVSDQAVPARSRRSFRANDLLGGAYQASLALESSVPVVAERPMYFDYAGRGSWHWDGGHCVMGARELASDYFFAEGCTRTGFEEWLCIQNPNPSPIEVEATYMLGTGATVEKLYTVPAAGRSTVFVADEVGEGQDVSVRLTCRSSPFLAERPTYFAYQGTNAWGWDGGHCVIGIPTGSREWFFAEGYTGPGFEEWICIQNPTGDEATVSIAYYPQGKDPITPDPFTVRANSRHTVYVNAHAGENLFLSAEVSSDKHVICERPMYFNYKGVWSGGHDVAGYAP